MVDIFTLLWVSVLVFVIGWICGSNFTLRNPTPLDGYDPYDPMEYVNRTDYMKDKDSTK